MFWRALIALHSLRAQPATLGQLSQLSHDSACHRCTRRVFNAVGILSALLGLGGGELMGPLLLGIGMEAQRRYGVRVEVKVRLRFRIGPGRERITALP